MSEKLRGLAFLEQKYNLNFKDKKLVHEGKSLFENVLNTKLGENINQQLSKRHALDFHRGLSAGNDRAIKDIKSFNSHMPDILRRLDFYMSDESKGILPSDISTEYEIDKIEENTGEKITQEQKQEIESNNKQFTKQLEKLPEDDSKLKSVNGGTGKVKTLFKKETVSSSSVLDVEGSLSNDDNLKESEDNKIELDNNPSEKHYNLTLEQENTIKQKFQSDNNDSKTSALIILDKHGNIVANYDSLAKFKLDKEKYNMFKDDVALSKRKIGVSFVREDGHALFFVPKSKYREYYPTHTFINRNKKKFKKKEDQKVTEEPQENK